MSYFYVSLCSLSHTCALSFQLMAFVTALLARPLFLPPFLLQPIPEIQLLEKTKQNTIFLCWTLKLCLPCTSVP